MFYLWWKENLAEYQNNSKYYNHDCLQNFILLVMSLLTAPIVKSSHILAKIYVLHQTWKFFNTKCGTQWNDWKNSSQEIKILTFFYKFVSLILG